MEKSEVIMDTSEQTKKKLPVREFLNSPYLFIFVPILAGAFYLMLHPEYISIGINHPYAVAVVVGLPLAVFAIKLVINFFSVIEQWIRLQFEKARNSRKSFFFELVILVFMFVSICEAGPFFNDIQHNVLAGVLGYVTVLAFDLIAVVCIDARRKEMAKGGSRSGIYLAGVIICALVSMTANLYSALENFTGPTAKDFPGLLKEVAPYIGIMFPVMIVFLAFSRDVDVDVDDAETYRKQQQKRVDFLSVRREILEKVTGEMERIELIQKREFFLKSLLFTKKKLNYVIEVVTGKMQLEVVALRKELAERDALIQDQVIAFRKEMVEKDQIIREQLDLSQQLLRKCERQQEIIASHMRQFMQSNIDFDESDKKRTGAGRPRKVKNQETEPLEGVV